jgi:hypothetical protein
LSEVKEDVALLMGELRVYKHSIEDRRASEKMSDITVTAYVIINLDG